MELRTPEKHLAQRAKSFSCSPPSNRDIPPSPKAEKEGLTRLSCWLTPERCIQPKSGSYRKGKEYANICD